MQPEAGGIRVLTHPENCDRNQISIADLGKNFSDVFLKLQRKMVTKWLFPSVHVVFSFSSHVKSFLDVGGVCFKFCPHSLAVDALQPLCSTSLLLTQKNFDFYKEAMLERLNSLISHQNHQNFLVRKFYRTTWRLELLRFRRKTVQLLNHHRHLPD